MMIVVIIVMMIVTLMTLKTLKECQKGDAVEAKLKGWTKYYKGKITRVNRDGTFDILFDDGDRKSKVDAKLIRSLERKKKMSSKSKKKKRSDDEMIIVMMIVTLTTLKTLKECQKGMQ